MRYTFEEVRLSATKSVKCKCGKRVRRSKTFFQTINPFNKRTDGQMKCRSDICTELTADVKQWKAEPELCAACRIQEDVR
jgi:hypothetical protein